MDDVWVAIGTKPEKRTCNVPGWPNCDSSGEVMYDNSHFSTEKAAWEHLRATREASVSLALSAVNEALAQTARADEQAGRAWKMLAEFSVNFAARAHLTGEGTT